jgi:protein O-mannosyl-transferase
MSHGRIRKRRMTRERPAEIAIKKSPGTVSLNKWGTPLTVALLSFIPFVPALSNQFVEWDDYENLISNPYYRGLGWSQIRWMFSTFHMGPYQPLSWMTLGLDYVIWGMNPVGYHLTNLILHVANAVLFYFICRRLLTLALPMSNSQTTWQLTMSAAFAALVFAIHPLRVESVAWATERRDVLSGFFFLATLGCYLRANADGGSRRWMHAALAVYVLSLLSKAITITLPAVLFILDIYPLRRLHWSPRHWLVSPERQVLREKIPFVLMAIPFALIALLGQQQVSALRSLDSYGPGSRLAQALFGPSFYWWKTVVPVKLSPLYEIPPHFSPSDPTIVAGVIATIILTICFYLLKNRWPAGLACWLYSIVILAPVLGIVQIGPQLVADRYSYLCGLSWAVLVGGILLYLIQKRSDAPAVLVAPITAVAIVCMLAALTWRQTEIWQDTATLWSHVLKLDPNSSIAHYNLGRFLAKKGKHTDAISHYRQALNIRPDDPDAHNNLGLLLAIRGEVQASLDEFQTAAQIDPNYAKAFFNLGRVYARQGELEKAIQNYRHALKLDPNQAEIHLGLGNVLARQGELETAMTQFQQAVNLKPDFADAHVALARLLAAQGRKSEAQRHYEKALRLIKSQNKAHRDGTESSADVNKPR